MNVSEIIKSTSWVEFNFLEDGRLYYSCVQRMNMEGSQTIFAFSIPIEDTPGGRFPRTDTNVIYYMRWIRKELQRLDEEQRMIAKAKEDWEREQEEIEAAIKASCRQD